MQAAQKRKRCDAPTHPSGDSEGAPETLPVKVARVQNCDQAPLSADTAADTQADTRPVEVPAELPAELPAEVPVEVPAEVPEVAPATTPVVRATLLLHYMHPLCDDLSLRTAEDLCACACRQHRSAGGPRHPRPLQAPVRVPTQPRL